MLTHPIFKAHYQAIPIPGEGVLLLSENGDRALYGPVYQAIAPLLDGRATQAIVDALAGRIDAAKVYYALLLLEKNGHITEAVPGIPPEAAAFWHGLGVQPQAAAETSRQRAVNLITLNSAFEAPLREALAELDIAVAGAGALDVVLADDYLHPALSEHNRAALVQGRSWLLAKLGGQEVWLGPWFAPGRTACYDCLRPRLERNQLARRFVVRKFGTGAFEPLPLACLPSTLALAARLLALEIAKQWAGLSESPLSGQVVSLNLATLASQTHPLARNPVCPACGEPVEAAPPAPIRLASRPAPFVRDGGHRAVAPEATVLKYQHLVSPITGVVRLLESVHKADDLTHVYIAGHNPTVPLDTLAFLRRGLRNASSGKGISDAQAKASALCEALERHAAEYTGREYRIAARYSDLSADAIHPAACMLYSERQYREREAWNAKGSKFNRVPERFDDGRVVNWSPVWSLTEQRHKYLPTQYLYFMADAADGDRTFLCHGCSNGNASGNNLEEAVLQGFCELIERDAVALWWYNRLRRPGVDVASFGEAYLLDLLAYYDGLGRDAWALDLTSDFGLPVFVAISRLRADEEYILLGMSCHLDPRIALQRAFAEMNQMLGLSLGNGESAHSKVDMEDVEVLQWLKSATLANQAYLAPDPAQPPRRRQDFPQQANGDLLEDIHHCRRLVEAQGLEMLVLEQTRPEVGLTAVKVIVPGLRHFWARFAPGRLYDVPVRMGWLAEPLSEEQLNPIPMFI